MEFNEKTINRLECPAGRTAVYESDPTTRGLYIQVTEAGTKTYVFRKKIDGTWRQKKLGRFKDLKIPEARAKADEFNSQLTKGVNVFELSTDIKALPAVADLFEEYMAKHASKRCTTADDMRKNFHRWFASILTKRATLVSHAEAESIHSKLGERAPYAANRAVQLARAVYNQAIKTGLHTGSNPFSGISLFPEHSRDRFLSNDEAGKLLRKLKAASLSDDMHQRALRDFILLDVMTGLRKTALVSARWDEIDLDAGTWNIPDTKSKNKQGQLVPLGDFEIDILKDRLAYLTSLSTESPFVFPGTGRTGHQMDFKKSWPSLRQKLGLEDVTIHDLRRSLAATMASANVNLVLIKNTLNQRDIKTTAKVYARTNKQAELEAKQKAHAIWFDAAKTPSKKSERAVTPATSSRVE